MFMYKVRTFCFFIIMIVSLLFFGLSFASSGESAHGSSGDAHHKGWTNEDTYRVTNFALLATVLFFLLRKPVSKALNQRIKTIKEELEELEKKKAKAEEELLTYKEEFADFEKKRESIIENYKEQGQLLYDKIIKEAEMSVEKIEAQAKKNIENEFKFAKDKIKQEIVDEAIAKAEDIIKNSISLSDQNKLLNDYLDKVA